MKKYLHLNQDCLKLTALATMTLDHIGKILCEPVCYPLVLISRTAFPIFSYLIMLHLFEKQCYAKYFVRLFSFGLITSGILILQNEFPINILWTFFIAIACIWLLDKVPSFFQNPSLKNVFRFLIFIYCFAASLGMDYSIFGFCYLLSLYGFFKYKTPLFVGLVLVFGGLINPSSSAEASISIITTGILLINNPKGADKRYIHGKWLFYIYYPAHLSILYALRASGIVF